MYWFWVFVYIFNITGKQNLTRRSKFQFEIWAQKSLIFTREIIKIFKKRVKTCPLRTLATKKSNSTESCAVVEMQMAMPIANVCVSLRFYLLFLFEVELSVS